LNFVPDAVAAGSCHALGPNVIDRHAPALSLRPTGEGLVMKLAIIFVCGVLLAGCVSRQEIAAQHAADEDTTCISYGLKFGTPEYAQCRQNAAAQRVATEQAQSVASMRLGQTIVEQQQQVNQQLYNSMRPNRPIQCMSNAFGTSIYTNCN